MLIWTVPAGLIVGLALGGLGGGGSTLALPALVYLLGQSTSAAVTGSLIIVGVSSAIGTIPHYRAGHVRLAQGASFGVLGIGGSYAGSRLSVLVPSDVLLTAFAALMIVVAVLMLRRRSADGTGDPEHGEDPVRRSHPGGRAGRLVAAATGVGLLTGFFGVGGGFAAVPVLALVLGFDMATAIGTSLLVITINSASALAARAAIGIDVNWVIIAVFSAAAVAGSLAGARLARRADPARLTAAFAVLLLVLAAYVAASSIARLA